MKHALLFFFSFCYSFGYAQNLVPNPSFEDTLWCPKQGIPYNGVADWYAVSKTPDYFHECFSPQPFSVPDNMLDYQYAATGFAYSGFYAYSTIDTNYREIIGVQLVTSLSVGIKYFVSFKLNATSRQTNGFSNKIGTLFSTVKYSDNISTAPSINNFCQMWTDSIITDTINWVLISGSFVADSEYTHLSIGNFFINAFTDTVRFRPIPSGAAFFLESYYFIDDVCVSEDSVTCSDKISTTAILENRKPKLVVFPNPANNLLSIETDIDAEGQFEFVTLSGQVLLRQKIPKGNFKFHKDIAQIADGIYFLKMISQNQSIIKKVIINH